MKDDTQPRIQRRRDLANSLHIPAELATRFTDGEMAALKIIADEHVRCGACTLARDAIAALSCTSRTVVKDAIRTAEAAGLLKREQIRGRGRRYTTITITSAEWPLQTSDAIIPRHLWRLGSTQPCTSPTRRTPATVGSEEAGHQLLAPIASQRRSLLQTVDDPRLEPSDQGHAGATL
jgi:hypothetical protein